MNERLRYRLGLRSSNAARYHRNRAREAKTGQAPWNAEDFRDMTVSEDCDCVCVIPCASGTCRYPVVDDDRLDTV